MADEGKAVWIGAIAGIGALSLAAWQFFGGTFALTKIDDIKGCNGFLIKEKPVILSQKTIPEAVEQKYLQDKILGCRDELQKDNKNATAYTNIGEAARRIGDLLVALKAQREALKLDPNLQEAKLGLALVQLDMGQMEEANKTIQDALNQKPSVIAYVYQGVVYIERKNWKSAEVSFRHAISLDPNLAEAYSNLGASLNEQNKTIEALAAYQKAISLNPNFAKAYYNLGKTLDEQNKTIEALAAYQKAISLNPNFADAHYNLGNFLYKQDKAVEAIIAYQKAISLNPNFAKAYYNLGVTLNKQGKIAEAISAYQKAISLNPNDAEAYYNFGNSLWQILGVGRSFTDNRRYEYPSVSSVAKIVQTLILIFAESRLKYIC